MVFDKFPIRYSAVIRYGVAKFYGFLLANLTSSSFNLIVLSLLSEPQKVFELAVHYSRSHQLFSGVKFCIERKHRNATEFCTFKTPITFLLVMKDRPAVSDDCPQALYYLHYDVCNVCRLLPVRKSPKWSNDYAKRLIIDLLVIIIV